jgi:Domain of unknown function (DUF4263)
MGLEGEVRTFRNLGFSSVVLHDGERVRVVLKATLIRRPEDNTPHSIELAVDRYGRASKKDGWPAQASQHIRIDGAAFEEAFAHMAAWREVLPYGHSTRYLALLVDEEHPNPAAILELLAGFRRNPQAFLPVMRLLSEGDAAALQAASNLARMRRCKDELVNLIAEDPVERTLQKWFEDHPWIFGSEYVGRIERRQFGIDSQGDFLLQTADNFIDLFELKRPTADVLRWDESHNAWVPARALADGLGQVLKYMETLDDEKFQLRDRFGLPVVYPRVRLVLGSSAGWDEQRRRALRRLNAHLVGIEVLTFDNVLARADVMIGHLAQSLEPSDGRPSKEPESTQPPNGDLDLDDLPF